MEKTSMRDIAKALGVSAVTVSNALAGKAGMSEALREKILKTADEMGYVNPRSSVIKVARDIGILIPERFFMTESYYGMFCRLLVRKLREEGHAGLVEVLGAEDERKLELPDLIRNRHVDGLIMLGETDKKYCRMMAHSGTPVLYLDFYDDSGSADAVVVDNTYGCYRLTSHLIHNGHTRIGFVGNPHTTASIMDRYLGFYRAMLSHRLEIRPEWILSDRDENGADIQIRLPKEMPEAFVCNCDLVAARLTRTLEKKGIRVPEDVSVTGFDDFLNDVEPTTPLSTFRPNTEGMAGIAVKRIIERCNGNMGPNEKIVVGGRPIYRQSDGIREKNEKR